MRRQESARFSGTVSKSHAANVADASAQTTITEIQMLNRLRKKSRSVFSALVKMTARLEQLKDALAQQRDKHMAERVADMYREYQLRVAYVQKRHEQRREVRGHWRSPLGHTAGTPPPRACSRCNGNRSWAGREN